MERIPELAPLAPGPARTADAPELVWIALHLTGLERALLTDLCRRGPFAGLDEVVCAGLWQLARQFDVPVTAFALGRGRHQP